MIIFCSKVWGIYSKLHYYGEDWADVHMPELMVSFHGQCRSFRGEGDEMEDSEGRRICNDTMMAIRDLEEKGCTIIYR